MKTRLTEAFGLEVPLVAAPMAGASGGALASAVSRAGGLGLIGGGYGDAAWLARELALAEAPVGVGFITWALTQQPELLAQALAAKPVAMMLSFGDVAPFLPELRAAGCPLIAQVQSRAQAEEALALGVDVLVAQGTEAGGHGATRGTMSLVPELADLIAARAPEVLLLAAGGIADGRGLAAALMLGADGAMLGSRFWAATEALVPERHHAEAVAACGDDTFRSSLPDIARGLDWPAPYTIRTLRNAFTQHWTPEALRAAGPAGADDYSARGPGIAGEAVGLIHDIRPAGEIVAEIVAGARAALTRGAL